MHAIKKAYPSCLLFCGLWHRRMNPTGVGTADLLQITLPSFVLFAGGALSSLQGSVNLPCSNIPPLSSGNPSCFFPGFLIFSHLVPRNHRPIFILAILSYQIVQDPGAHCCFERTATGLWIRCKSLICIFFSVLICFDIFITYWVCISLPKRDSQKKSVVQSAFQCPVRLPSTSSFPR